MELKSQKNAAGFDETRCSNRTFMELKSDKIGFERVKTWRSNRTFMELKYWSVPRL